LGRDQEKERTRKRNRKGRKYRGGESNGQRESTGQGKVPDRKRNGAGKSCDRFKAEKTDIYHDGPLSLLTVQSGVFFEEYLQLLRSSAGTPFLPGMRGGALQDWRGLFLRS
jgi:hypothetical protein